MSGLMLIGLAARDMLPVRPKPQITSSAMNSMSYLLQHRLDLLEIGLGRHDHAARAHHRLGDHGRDRVRPLLAGSALELLGAARGELLLGLAVLAEAVVVRAVGVQDAGDRQVEVAVVVAAGRSGWPPPR